MNTVSIEPNFQAWRHTARRLLTEHIHPRDVLWSSDDSTEYLQFDAKPSDTTPATSYTVSPSFLRLAERVSCHRSNRQWALLYDLLWAMTHGGDRNILRNTTHPAVRELERMRGNIDRDLHKMQAFVRFRKVKTEADPETYVAWYEPEHRILRTNAVFFYKRFTGMQWSILTPDECAHWKDRRLSFTPGVCKDQAPHGDSFEELWLQYYRSTFNPARVKIRMMQSEMPKKYWKNLPEADLIPELIQGSAAQVQAMADEQPRPVLPMTRNAYLQSLDELNRSPESGSSCSG